MKISTNIIVLLTTSECFSLDIQGTTVGPKFTTRKEGTAIKGERHLLLRRDSNEKKGKIPIIVFSTELSIGDKDSE